MLPVSVCVIARDEESQIASCLDSVGWADERIVVLDDRSSDRTEAIARELGARVVHHAYEGNIEQKNFALDQAKNDWVVALDADEVLSPELSRRLRDLLAAADGSFDGVEMNRATRHLGRWLRHGDFHPDWQLRAFRRTRGRWAGSNPHGRVVVATPCRRIAGDLEHHSYRDLGDQIARVGEFSRIEAEVLHRSGRRARVRDLVLRPPARFLRAYVLKAGFLDGLPGFIVAGVTAFHVFLKYARLWELGRAGRGRRARGTDRGSCT